MCASCRPSAVVYGGLSLGLPRLRCRLDSHFPSRCGRFCAFDFAAHGRRRGALLLLGSLAFLGCAPANRFPSTRLSVALLLLWRTPSVISLVGGGFAFVSLCVVADVPVQAPLPPLRAGPLAATSRPLLSCRFSFFRPPCLEALGGTLVIFCGRLFALSLMVRSVLFTPPPLSAVRGRACYVRSCS